MTEDEPLRRNTTVRVGLLADPGLPTELAEWLAEHLPRALREAVSDEVGWYVTSRSEPIPLDGDGQVPITDLAREHRGAQEWDLLLVLTDLPRRIGTNPLASAFRPEVRAGLVSVPALGAVGVRSRAMAIALRLVGRLAGPVLDEAGVSPARDPAPRREILDPTRPMPSDDSDGGAELALVGLRGRLRLLTGMVRANRPWRLVPQLSSATAAAVATAAYASVTVSFWQMAAALSPTRLILINLLAVGAMTVWLIAYNRLWDRPADPAERVKAVLYNAAPVLTLLVGVVCMNMLLFLVMLVAAAALIDPGYLAQTVHQPGVLDVYLELVWLGSSIGIVAGALGSSLESEEAVHNATYGARERERRPVSEDLPHQVDVLGRASELDTQLNVLRLGNLTAGYLRYGPEIRDADRGGVQLLPASGIRRPLDVSRADSAQLGVSVALRGDGPSGRRGDGEGRRHARGLECKLHG